MLEAILVGLVTALFLSTVGVALQKRKGRKMLAEIEAKQAYATPIDPPATITFHRNDRQLRQDLILYVSCNGRHVGELGPGGQSTTFTTAVALIGLTAAFIGAYTPTASASTAAKHTVCKGWSYLPALNATGTYAVPTPDNCELWIGDGYTRNTSTGTKTAIKVLQITLNVCYPSQVKAVNNKKLLDVDGKYGERTQLAVGEVQKTLTKSGVKVDYVYGKATRNAMKHPHLINISAETGTAGPFGGCQKVKPV
jgi:hypothetical protein